MKAPKKIACIDCYLYTDVKDSIDELGNYLKPDFELTYTTAGQFTDNPDIYFFDSIADSDGYIVLGSASHVHEELGWHTPLLEFVLKSLNQNKPVLGICFGHQVLASHFGASLGFAYKDQRIIKGSRSMHSSPISSKVHEIGVTHRMIALDNGILQSDSNNLAFPTDFLYHPTLPLVCTQTHPEAGLRFLKEECQILDHEKRLEVRKSGHAWILTVLESFFKSVHN